MIGRMNAPTIIATRESRLALWQAHHVRDRLSALYPACSVELLGMTTVGDQVLDRSLNEIGGKGLFNFYSAMLRVSDRGAHRLDVPRRRPPAPRPRRPRSATTLLRGLLRRIPGDTVEVS